MTDYDSYTTHISAALVGASVGVGGGGGDELLMVISFGFEIFFLLPRNILAHFYETIWFILQDYFASLFRNFLARAWRSFSKRRRRSTLLSAPRAGVLRVLLSWSVLFRRLVILMVGGGWIYVLELSIIYVLELSIIYFLELTIIYFLELTINISILELTMIFNNLF